MPAVVSYATLACQREAAAVGNKRQADRAIGSYRNCGLDKPQPISPSGRFLLCLLLATSVSNPTGPAAPLSVHPNARLWIGETRHFGYHRLSCSCWVCRGGS